MNSLNINDIKIIVEGIFNILMEPEMNCANLNAAEIRKSAENIENQLIHTLTYQKFEREY